MSYTASLLHAIKHNPLRMVNHGLTVIVAALGVYIVMAPFWPQVTWWLHHQAPMHTAVFRSAGASTPSSAPPAGLSSEVKELIIPSLGLRETIHLGGLSELNKGVWHVPYTSTPDKGANTVLIGHRFTYSGQAVFYHLDKMLVGDPLTVFWQGKAYHYQIFAITVVPPTEVSVEAPTAEPQLTIYTCTPLWTAKDRLVLRAKLIGIDPS